MALCSDACAVMRITGVSGSCSRTAASRSVPDTPGILISVSTMSGAPALSASKPALPPWAVVTSNPSPFNRIRSTSRIPISSSTTRMDGCALISRGFLSPSGCRQVHRERGPASRGGIHQDQAAVRLHGALHDREPQPGPADPPRDERLEQAGPQGLGGARALVGDGEHHGGLQPPPPPGLLPTGPAGAHPDAGLPAGGFLSWGAGPADSRATVPSRSARGCSSPSRFESEMWVKIAVPRGSAPPPSSVVVVTPIGKVGWGRRPTASTRIARTP